MASKRYGLIGERLGHSFSPMIHSCLADYDYELISIPKYEIDEFMQKRDFAALNVTIPYKKTVMPYCDILTPIAQKIGSVNTLVMQPDGRLLGDNTDYHGFLAMADSVNIDFKGKKVLVLGSGGTSLTARTAAADRGAKEIIVVSRGGEVNYQNVYDISDADIIVNTTPVGMYPHNGDRPIDLLHFPKLSGVLDVVYNPLRSMLILQAKRLGIPCASGLLMLVAQAKCASERFTGSTIDDSVITDIEIKLRRQITNLALIGMPGSGKTTLSKLCAERMEREAVEIDSIITARAGMDIPSIFAERGEKAFRRLESQITMEHGGINHRVISTGGGVVKNRVNIDYLHQNSVVVWIRRPIELLATEGRPLSAGGLSALEKLWEERRELYADAADFVIDNTGDLNEAAKRIVEGFYEVISNKRA